MPHHYVNVKGDSKNYGISPEVARRKALNKIKRETPKPEKTFLEKITKKTPTTHGVAKKREWQERLRRFHEKEAEKQAIKKAEELGLRKRQVYKNSARTGVDKKKEQALLSLIK